MAYHNFHFGVLVKNFHMFVLLLRAHGSIEVDETNLSLFEETSNDDIHAHKLSEYFGSC